MRRVTRCGLPRWRAVRLGAAVAACGLLAWSCSGDTTGNGARVPAGEAGMGAEGGAGPGPGGAAGSTAETVTTLGRACSSSADCGGGLECLTAESVEINGQGPAHGYCTTRCDAIEACEAITPGAVCLQFAGPLSASFCMLGCEPGPEFAIDFSRSKCDARADVSCSPLVFEGSDLTAFACLPRCRSDADCGSERVCDQYTGLCGDSAPAGDAYWSPCDPDGDLTCRGFCADFSSWGMAEGVCVEPCTQGTYGCGWPGSGAAEGVCDFLYEGMSAAGDEGFCVQMCDCDDDCRHPETRCYELDPNAQRGYGRRGICYPITEGEPTLPCGAGGAGGAGSGGAGGAAAGGTAGAAAIAGAAGVAGAGISGAGAGS